MRPGPGRISVQGPGPPTAARRIPVTPKSGGLPAVAHGPEAGRSLLPPTPRLPAQAVSLQDLPLAVPAAGKVLPPCPTPLATRSSH